MDDDDYGFVRPWYQRAFDWLSEEHVETLGVLLSGFAILLIFVGVFWFFAYPHHDEENTRNALDSAGYEDIEIKDEGGWFACGKMDFYKTPFRATNPKGKEVEGVVCCGMWAKDCTIRY